LLSLSLAVIIFMQHLTVVPHMCTFHSVIVSLLQGVRS